jgi:hypothetical protein
MFMPVAHAPIENAFSAKSRSVGYVQRTQFAVSRWTSWSSFAERSQLYGVPDEPADSSTIVPAIGWRPSQQRSANQ